MAITAAEKVLIPGGLLNLAYGVLLGYAITVIRVKGAPATPKYLMAAHVGVLLQAAGLRNNGTAISGENDLEVVGPGRVAAVRVAHTPVSACCVEFQEVSPAPLRAVSGRASWCSGRSASCGMVIASVRSRQGSAG